MGGVILSAPSSGSGKTTLTLGLIRAAVRRGVAVVSAKSGPDYIDPRFHAAASGMPCVNLDAWAMSDARLRSLALEANMPLIIEGAMGLFDGAPPNGKGSSADLARILGMPVVLVVDAGKMAGSVAAVVRGFMIHDPAVHVAGVILNNVGSPRHEAMLRRALAPLEITVLGAVPRMAALATPSRHLGLMQASERNDLDAFLDAAAEVVAAHVDVSAILALAGGETEPVAAPRMAPPAQRIAVAQDQAFGFNYPHMLADWHAQGAEIAVFSPLADEAVPEADFVFLPGGYPELHAGRLAANMCFLKSLRNAAQTSEVYGECGGYMTLGKAIIDADGISHEMAGLLDVTTSFASRKLHLGYRDLTGSAGAMAGHWKGHEFHYSTIVSQTGDPLFVAKDAEGTELGHMGLHKGRVSGSYAHIIDQA
jgi:cobyrinic acid a,c-diamide synthase